MKISRFEYEEFIRDSERLKMIKILAKESRLVYSKNIFAICECAPEESEDVLRDS